MKFLTIFCLALGAAIAPLMAADDEFNLTGDWSGVIAFDGEEIPVVFRLEHVKNSISGSLLSPTQTPQPIPLSSADYRDGKFFADIELLNTKYEGRVNPKTKKIRGDYYAGEGQLSLDLEFTAGGFAMERPQTPSAPYPYGIEQFTFPNKFSQQKLGGTLTLPKDVFGKIPAVVLISDTGPHDRDGTVADHKPFAVIADYLAKRGIAVLRYDDRGVGRSGGTHEFGSTLDFATDAWAAVEFLKNRPDIDPTKIGLIGHGEGGLIAPIVANKRNDIAWMLLLAAPTLKGDETLLLQTSALSKVSGLGEEMQTLTQELTSALYRLLVDANPDATEAQALSEAFQKKVATLPDSEKAKLGDVGTVLEQQFAAIETESPWLRNFLKLDPADYLTPLKIPTLALYGELDLQVFSEQHAAAMKKHLPTAKIETIRDANHLFQKAKTGLPSEYSMIEETIQLTVLRKMADWIAETNR